MEKTTDILNELKSISPLIAEINKVNVFTVPHGYFSSIGTTVLACVFKEHELNSLSYNNQSSDVPEGYFDRLADSILQKIKTAETANDEIRNLSPLLYQIQKNNVFEIPEGYFNSLNETIINKIKTASYEAAPMELPPFLSGIQKKNVFETPAGYFENLDEIIIGRLKTATSKEELKVLSPLLFGIGNKEILEVPAGYFVALTDSILKKVHPQKAKVVVMHKRSLFIKYAVGAMMTGVLALGFYKYFDQRSIVRNPDQHVATLDASIEKGKNMNDLQFNEALQNLTEADIAKYLEKNGDITDVAVLKNNLDETSLPSQEDYLLDESTLEQYLKEIEQSTPTIN